MDAGEQLRVSFLSHALDLGALSEAVSDVEGGASWHVGWARASSVST